MISGISSDAILAEHDGPDASREERGSMSNYHRPDAQTLSAIYERAARIQFNDERVIKEVKAGRLMIDRKSVV